MISIPKETQDFKFGGYYLKIYNLFGWINRLISLEPLVSHSKKFSNSLKLLSKLFQVSFDKNVKNLSFSA